MWYPQTDECIGAVSRMFICALIAVLLMAAVSASAQERSSATAAGSVVLQPARTETPQATLESFQRLRDDLAATLKAYSEERSRANAARAFLIAQEWRSLLDLSDVPETLRDEIGGETGAYLLDIFNRIGWPEMQAAPDQDRVLQDQVTAYTIPRTPFRIVLIEEGVRAGEFLFSANTVTSAPRFFRTIAHLPPQGSDGIASWLATVRQVTGPLVPSALVNAVPEILQPPLLGTPIWKILLVFLVSTIAAAVLVWWDRFVTLSNPSRHFGSLWARMLSPLAIAGTAVLLHDFFSLQVNVAGGFSRGVDVTRTLIVYLALASLFWLAARAILEIPLGGSRYRDESLDSNMLRLFARIAGLVGAIVILAYGAQDLGLPVFSILAGLGIGGLAIALAIRPTLENLIGGFILYLDRPIRVGDFCSFGDRSGTVENIGVRSTQVRALDRTLITIPNAQFADMQIVNWARCDRMLISQRIGLRYETDLDQLRFVLAKIREMLHGHPRIDSETVRVRFANFGASSLDLDIRIYAKTREWNDFFAIQEDILFRVKGVVESAGTGFAFPSQTIYFSRDGGLDAALGDVARQTVAAWRRNDKLPFPRFDDETLSRIDDTLDYPPIGSSEAAEREPSNSGAERLSSEPLSSHTELSEETGEEHAQPERR